MRLLTSIQHMRLLLHKLTRNSWKEKIAPLLDIGYRHMQRHLLRVRSTYLRLPNALSPLFFFFYILWDVGMQHVPTIGQCAVPTVFFLHPVGCGGKLSLTRFGIWSELWNSNPVYWLVNNCELLADLYHIVTHTHIKTMGVRFGGCRCLFRGAKSAVSCCPWKHHIYIGSGAPCAYLYESSLASVSNYTVGSFCAALLFMVCCCLR